MVIGIEYSRVIELAALWLRKENVALASHPVQRVILEEIALQLEVFGKYSEKIKKSRHLTPIFERDLAIIQDILKEKQKIQLGDYANDRVMNGIQTRLATF